MLVSRLGIVAALVLATEAGACSFDSDPIPPVAGRGFSGATSLPGATAGDGATGGANAMAGAQAVAGAGGGSGGGGSGDAGRAGASGTGGSGLAGAGGRGSSGRGGAGSAGSAGMVSLLFCQQPGHSGMACDDGSFCTTGDKCSAGLCKGSSRTDCSLLTNACNLGVCNELDARCEATPLPASTGCEDGLFCTAGDHCSGGACVPGPARDCGVAGNACNVGQCDESQRKCIGTPTHEGMSCAGADQCKSEFVCHAGECSAPASVCAPGDTCTRACAQSCLCDLGCAGAVSCSASCAALAQCTLDCTGSTACNATCGTGASCTFTCSQGLSCHATCAAGSNCKVNCAGNDDCEVSCNSGASCEIDCRDADQCNKIDCPSDAQCLLHCSQPNQSGGGMGGPGNGRRCDFRTCSNPVECVDGSISCGGAQCPQLPP